MKDNQIKHRSTREKKRALKNAMVIQEEDLSALLCQWSLEAETNPLFERIAFILLTTPDPEDMTGDDDPRQGVGMQRFGMAWTKGQITRLQTITSNVIDLPEPSTLSLETLWDTYGSSDKANRTPPVYVVFGLGGIGYMTGMESSFGVEWGGRIDAGFRADSRYYYVSHCSLVTSGGKIRMLERKSDDWNDPDKGFPLARLSYRSGGSDEYLGLSREWRLGLGSRMSAFARFIVSLHALGQDSFEWLPIPDEGSPEDELLLESNARRNGQQKSFRLVNPKTESVPTFRKLLWVSRNFLMGSKLSILWNRAWGIKCSTNKEQCVLAHWALTLPESSKEPRVVEWVYELLRTSIPPDNIPLAVNLLREYREKETCPYLRGLTDTLQLALDLLHSVSFADW